MLPLIPVDFLTHAPVCNSFFNCALLANTSMIITFLVSCAGFHLSTDPPLPHPFGIGLHEYSPFRCISPCLGSWCLRPWVAQRSKRTYWKRLMRVAQSMTISFPLRPPCGLVPTPSAEIRLGHICLLWLIYFFDLFVRLSVLTVSNVIYTYNLYYLRNTSKQCICTTFWTKMGKA